MRLIREFIRLESSGGIVLFSFAIAALIIDNTPWSTLYNSFLNTPVIIQVGALELHKPLVTWVNDGLMAIFFLLVGLEIKREVLEGELNTYRKSVLPVIAAIGGMVGPAIVYCFLNAGSTVALQGWAIPTATDIAFALGILVILGSRIPPAMKVFLTALAILDDLAAILVIAIFYTANLSYLSLSLACIGLATLIVMNRIGITRYAPYIIVGLALWVCVLKSGVHATLTGVALAFAIPLRAENRLGVSPARNMEQALIPWVAFGVLPLFAFVNSGIRFTELHPSVLMSSIPLGIAAGLFIGKQLGIFTAIWLAVKTHSAHLPAGATWLSMYGLAMICGVGFTMSLFIGDLAFTSKGMEYQQMVRLGVLVGSTLSGICGYMLLRAATSKAR